VTQPYAAVVTGAGSGIGAAVVRTLLEQDAHARVTGIDRRFGSGPADALGERFQPIVADLRDPREVRRAVADATTWLGTDVTVLVQCAGVYRAAPLLDCDEDGWDDTFAVNVRAVFLVAQAVVRHRSPDAGPLSIVNVASTAAVRGYLSEPAAAYNASKAAVVALTRQMAGEWARAGVRANALLPGFTDTPMVRIMDDPVEGGRRIDRLVPLGRMADADEVAGAVHFLASPAAAYITGAELAVDGGLLLTLGDPTAAPRPRTEEAHRP
jgi:NAD(P)-dependent dehydrogenase (short-subunit alcohol dehydrogenase family)